MIPMKRVLILSVIIVYLLLFVNHLVLMLRTYRTKLSQNQDDDI